MMIPAQRTFEQAATVGVGLVTVRESLYQLLQLNFPCLAYSARQGGISRALFTVARLLRTRLRYDSRNCECTYPTK